MFAGIICSGVQLLHNGGRWSGVELPTMVHHGAFLLMIKPILLGQIALLEQLQHRL